MLCTSHIHNDFWLFPSSQQTPKLDKQSSTPTRTILYYPHHLLAFLLQQMSLLHFPSLYYIELHNYYGTAMIQYSILNLFFIYEFILSGTFNLIHTLLFFISCLNNLGLLNRLNSYFFWSIKYNVLLTIY